MAVSIRILDSFASTANATNYNSGTSFTPAANSLLLFIFTVDGYLGAGPSVLLSAFTTMTFEGGATWNSGPADSAFVYSYIVPGTTAATGVSISALAAAATGINWVLVEVTGSDLSASPPWTQLVFNSGLASGNPTVTFPTPLGRESAYVAAIGVSRTVPAIGAPPAWTAGIETGHLLPSQGQGTVYRAGGETGTQTLVFPGVVTNWIVVGVEVPPAIRFTAQPTQQTASVGGTATFTATVTGSTGLQWQSAPITSLYSQVPGVWSDIVGQTSSSLTTGTLAAADNGTWYRLKATTAADTSFSEAVRLFIRGQAVTGKGATPGSPLNGLGGWEFQHSMDRQYKNLLLRPRLWPGDNDDTEAKVWRDWYGFTAAASGFHARYYYDMISQSRLGS